MSTTPTGPGAADGAVAPGTAGPAGATAVRSAPLVRGRAPFVVTGVMAVVAAVSAGVSLFVPSLLFGAEVGKGNLRGTALVVLVVALPVLALGVPRTAAGSGRGLVAWLAAAAYLLYQSVLFCFATPMNRLLPAYIAWLGLGIWTVVVLLRSVDVDAYLGRTGPGLPVRLVAGVTAGFALLNGGAWLAKIVPAVLTDTPGSVLEGSGLDTSPVWVQDLAFWIPAALVLALRMWRRERWGVLLTAGVLGFYVIECLSIASDQWWGARADASQPDFASTSMVVPFTVLAVLTLLPLLAYLRHVDRRG